MTRRSCRSTERRARWTAPSLGSGRRRRATQATTYPLIVALPAGSHGIAAGSAAQVAIVLDDAHETLAVPTSAVHTVGTNEAYILLLRGGQPVRQTVKVGIVGDVYTQITSGVTKGDEIVLADLTTAVPSSSSTTMSRFGAGLGGLTGGGGLGGGGFTGGDGFTGGEGSPDADPATIVGRFADRQSTPASPALHA